MKMSISSLEKSVSLGNDIENSMTYCVSLFN